MTTNDDKANAWQRFSNHFLTQLREIDPDRLHPAFAKPVKGSSGEVIIDAMRRAFSATIDSVIAGAQANAFKADGEPSTAWDMDFKEPIG